MMMDCESYIKNEDISENKETFVYAFNHVKTDKVDKHIKIGSESHVLYENNKLFNLFSNRFINKEIEMRKFKVTGWPLMTLVKRNSFFEIQGCV